MFNNKEKNLYATDNIYLAAYLHCKGIEFVRKEEMGHRRISWLFNEKDKCDNLARNYYEDKETTVSARRLESSQRAMKAIIFQLDI